MTSLKIFSIALHSQILQALLFVMMINDFEAVDNTELFIDYLRNFLSLIKAQLLNEN
jgi:hypothetical protein